jgi:hypothetical protein
VEEGVYAKRASVEEVCEMRVLEEVAYAKMGAVGVVYARTVLEGEACEMKASVVAAACETTVEEEVAYARMVLEGEAACETTVEEGVVYEMMVSVVVEEVHEMTALVQAVLVSQRPGVGEGQEV